MNNLKNAAKELGSRGGKKTAKRGPGYYRAIQKLAAKKRKENRLKAKTGLTK